MATLKQVSERFAQFTGGKRQRFTIELPLDASYDAEKGVYDGQTIKVDLAPLDMQEEILVLAGARAFAAENGGKEDDTADPIYEKGLKLHTLLHACVDSDSQPDAPKPFFESVEEIRGQKLLSPDHLEMLFEAQVTHQDNCSPRQLDLPAAHYVAAVVHLAGGNLPFFLRLRPGMQWSLLRTMAAQLLDSQALKLPSSSPSSTTTRDTSEPSASEQ
jgi:hypothetical protein